MLVMVVMLVMEVVVNTGDDEMMVGMLVMVMV